MPLPILRECQGRSRKPEFHQTTEIANIDFLETRTYSPTRQPPLFPTTSSAVLTQVSGQIIRSGVFQDRAFSEAMPSTLKLKMLRNPNMVENGRFPTAIQEFKYEPARLAVAEVEYRDLRAEPQISDCGEYEVQLTEAFRFPEQDTLVFHVTVNNRTDEPLQHAPELIEVRVGDRVFNPSLIDLVSVVGPSGTASGYIAISGGPHGQRNDLSLKSDFTFALARLDPEIEAAVNDFKNIESAELPKWTRVASSICCKVIEALEVAGIMNAQIRFHLPGNVSFENCKTVLISQQKKEEGS